MACVWFCILNTEEVGNVQMIKYEIKCYSVINTLLVVYVFVSSNETTDQLKKKRETLLTSHNNVFDVVTREQVLKTKQRRIIKKVHGPYFL